MDLMRAADGFPAGQDSPEGVACDLARVFIHHDVELFKRIVMPVYGTPEQREQYTKFLAMVEDGLPGQARQLSPQSPLQILICYAVRDLSDPGPAAYGKSEYGFQNVQFVDIRAQLRNEEMLVNRTLVLQDEAGKWFVHPLPATSPCLSVGLGEERLSTVVCE